jgi:hypothetical protein
VQRLIQKEGDDVEMTEEQEQEAKESSELEMDNVN